MIRQRADTTLSILKGSNKGMADAVNNVTSKTKDRY